MGTEEGFDRGEVGCCEVAPEPASKPGVVELGAIELPGVIELSGVAELPGVIVLLGERLGTEDPADPEAERL